MAGAEEVSLPLGDEPIGRIVAELQSDDPVIADLVRSPRGMLAFRTLARIRLGVLLGRLLLEADLTERDGGETWVEMLLRDPDHRAAAAAELRAAAEEVARDHPDEAGGHGPDDETRERFREFARPGLE